MDGHGQGLPHLYILHVWLSLQRDIERGGQIRDGLTQGYLNSIAPWRATARVVTGVNPSATQRRATATKESKCRCVDEAACPDAPRPQGS